METNSCNSLICFKVLKDIDFNLLSEDRFTKADSQHPIMREPPLKDSPTGWMSSFVRQIGQSGCRPHVDYMSVPDSRLRALRYRLPRAPISSIQRLGDKCLVRRRYPTDTRQKKSLNLLAKTLM